MRYFREICCLSLGMLMSLVMNAYADTSNVNLGDANQFADPTSTLAQQGAQLFVMGEDQLIVIPTDRTFIHRSMLLKKSAYPFLDDLVQYLRNINKVNLRITVYSPRNSEGNESGLSKQRARSLANYLWIQNIDTRVMSIKGYDNSPAFPFIRGLSPKQFENGRVEISFREQREYV